ncbi:MAG: hypothetical protein HKN67_12190 [Saprospiraceae bacterium]|nr:hypothetical protein [Saprospiraceae bacterium]
MQAGKRYKLIHTLNWTKKAILVFTLWAFVPLVLHNYFDMHWIHLPWQPISLIGIAVAFYLGFKNNSSYERMWEARKIWGGIVNTSRSITVMFRDFINNDEAINKHTDEELGNIRKEMIHRHVSWLHALTYQLRKLKEWEHTDEKELIVREELGVTYSESQFDKLKEYLNQGDFEYVMSKGNRASHILSLQSKRLSELRRQGIVEHFRHLEIQALITELYTLQGKSERIKNFPFPRQYATVNYFFVVLFIILLPFGMVDVFSDNGDLHHISWLSIPFSVVGSWVFWMMEMIGEYSENPFEGLYNDVPISSMAVGIERDIRQMIEETDLPDPVDAKSKMDLLM